MPIVFSSGETLGRLRFGSQICRFQDFILYHAEDEVKRREVLVRQYAPEEPEKAMSGLPAAGRHAKSRWDQLLDVQRQRFELARKALPPASPYHVSFIDYLLDDTFYAILSHPAAAMLNADFGEIKSPSEPALHQLLLPILEVVSGLHKGRVLYCGLGPEEILLDRSDPGSLGIPVFAGFGSVYHWGGMGPPRPRADDRPSWAPECFDRQAPLTAAADVYALGALTYQLMAGTPPAPARARLKGAEHPSITDLAPSYSSSLRRAVDQALALDPEARFPSVQAFRELALPAVARPSRPAPPRRPAATPAPRQTARRPAPIGLKAAALAVNLRAIAISLAGGLAGLASRAARLAPRRAPARAPLRVPPIEPVLKTARARVAETLDRLRPGAPPRATGPQPQLAPVVELDPTIRNASLAQDAGPPASRAEPGIAKRVRGAAKWLTTGFAAARRQWQPAAALFIVAALAAGAWWLKSAQVWPLGPFERSAAPGHASVAPAATRDTPATGAAEEGAPAASAASPASASEGQADAARPPEPKRSQLIADIQKELTRLEVYDGPIDGIDTPAVRNALAAARTKYDLPGPVSPGKRLLTRLRNQLVDEPLPVTAAAPPSETARVQEPAPVVEPARPKQIAATVYPRSALGREIEGWVEVTFDIDPEGDVQNARITSAENSRAATYFSEPALKAIRATSFFPATESNRPVWSRGVTRRFVFTLQRNR